MTGRKIAVIGGGISGLSAAYILARTDEVAVFEAGDRLGGHAHTHLVPRAGGAPVAVDTGFIVYNERTYPLLTRLFRELGVTTQASEMSMSVSCSGCGVQYAGKRSLDRRTRLRVTQRHDFGAHYAATLRIWRDRFCARQGEVTGLGFDPVFLRMWLFYLCYAEAGFRAGYLNVSQLTLERA